ncbi:MAG: glycosyltransferase family 2 protein [Bacteroidetes bacterium]|nr:glycosyltransferase family 2 protein [Bacteroidota bacterium]
MILSNLAGNSTQILSNYFSSGYYLRQMKVSAFTYVRNGFTIDYPFLEAIKSVLPVVDEFIVVIGDSNDGTREAVENLNDNRIKIVDTIWDDKMRTGGLIFAQQSNIGIDNCNADADWLFHIQADEIIHENDLPKIKQAMFDNLSNKQVQGLLFKFINFFGDYNHYAPSRRFHQHEIRIIRNNKNIRSYRDSQGFRLYSSPEKTNVEKGEKLTVKAIDASVYHYSHVRSPKQAKKKHIEFGNRYNATNDWVKEYEKVYKGEYDYSDFDYLFPFTKSHPSVMQKRVNSIDWKFNYNPAKNNMTTKEKLLKALHLITDKRFFEYKNYKLI